LKWAVGIASERELPRFAEGTFRRRAAGRGPAKPPAPGGGGGRVLLWVDTLTNHFQPHIPEAPLDVLGRAGFGVVLSPERLCCGRPLYDWGMLDLARERLERILVALRPELERGTPIVVLEPSCASVFRDELPNLLAGHRDARRLAGQ